MGTLTPEEQEVWNSGIRLGRIREYQSDNRIYVGRDARVSRGFWTKHHALEYYIQELIRGNFHT